MNQIKQIYDILLQEFGPQGWWPIVNGKTLLCEYHVSAPRNEKEALEICFGSLLAQNTSWKNAEKAMVNLKKENLINVKKIIETKDKKLAQIIRSSGYHNQKAKKLKNFCEFLLKNYDGKLSLFFKNRLLKLRKQLLSVNEIGPETADSIILYSAKKPIFVVDAYTKKILSRLGYMEKTYDELQVLFMQILTNSEKLFNEYHALMVELGKNICKKEPLCEKCPLSAYCDYYKKRV